VNELFDGFGTTARTHRFDTFCWSTARTMLLDDRATLDLVTEAAPVGIVRMPLRLKRAENALPSVAGIAGWLTEP
jgi:hypothetical protein